MAFEDLGKIVRILVSDHLGYMVELKLLIHKQLHRVLDAQFCEVLPDRLARAVVGAIGDMDAYMLPGAKGATAMWRALCGDTDELRDRIREEALSTTLKDFHDFAPWLAKTLKASVPCALGGSEVENVARANGWATKKLL